MSGAYLCVVSILEVSGRDERTRGWNLFQCIIPGIMSWNGSQHRALHVKELFGEAKSRKDSHFIQLTIVYA